MKPILLALVALIASSCGLLSNSNTEDNFIIRKYSVSLNKPIQETLFHRGKYYCLTNYGRLICLTSKFQIDTTITTLIDKEAFDFVYENADSLIGGRYNGENHYLGNDYAWRKHPNNIRLPALYEDNAFTAYQCCAGEFGGGLFFHEKKTGHIYSIPATCAVAINKISSNYYVTTSLAHGSGFSKVLLIPNPTMLYNMDNPEVDTLKNYCNWADIVKSKNREKYYDRAFARKVFEKGSTTLLDSMGTMAVASFIRNNKLYHLTTDFNHTTLAEIRNHAFVTLDTISNNAVWSYQPSLKNYPRMMIYSYSNDKSSGFITISEDTITYVKFR
ncbi:hypothetical protein [Hymenobacter ruricola]|uniref:Uncharacterized protein n=1 Tax=Hymenobacter ruricola TaxID=2791023 RepID=A0ABS0I0M8_9BACT|nr:hypothetical protein [Hymenobacter ruricola]MBF9220485.1 hypothetical protein [Hymenobacter ruricola]